MDIKRKLIIEGHRGCRGLLPENSIPAFLHAIDLGVTTLELDVVISADKKVVVSHEPWMNEDICLDPQGKPIEVSKRDFHNLYKMDYQMIRAFDCGSKSYPAFPLQQRMKTYKPLLSDVVNQVNIHCKKLNKKPPYYNIEIKSEVELDNMYQPEPKEFCELVYNLINELNILSLVTLQSFDPRILRELNTYKNTSLQLSYLVEDKVSYTQHLQSLGFKPDIYSPEYTLLNEDIIKDLHNQGIQVIPWTVNTKKDMEQMIQWGVDGLITDYPDVAIEMVKQLHNCEVL